MIMIVSPLLRVLKNDFCPCTEMLFMYSLHVRMPLAISSWMVGTF